MALNKTGWFKVTVYSLKILEATLLNSRCQQDHALSEGSRGGSFLAFFLLFAFKSLVFVGL